jgi:hypothetical protein
MEAVRTSETSVYSNETTQSYIAEGSLLHTHRRENMKPHRRCFLCHYVGTTASPEAVS